MAPTPTALCSETPRNALLTPGTTTSTNGVQARSKPHLNLLPFAFSSSPFIKSRLLVFWHLGIDAIRPRQNPAGQVVYFLESGLLEKHHRFPAAHTGAAVRHDFAAGIKFVDTLRQVTERDQM